MEYNRLPKKPLSVVTELLGTKWKMLVIKQLLSGDMRFNELKKTLGCTSKSLIKTLKELETDGFVLREKDDREFNKVVYYLTDIGYSFLPVISAMENWGKDYKKLRKLQEKYSVS